MSRRRDLCDLLQWEPPALSRRAKWILAGLTVIAVVLFLVGDLLIRHIATTRFATNL